jgi:hypothetical protein
VVTEHIRTIELNERVFSIIVKFDHFILKHICGRSMRLPGAGNGEFSSILEITAKRYR